MRKIPIIILFTAISFGVKAQNDSLLKTEFGKFSLIASVDFQNFSLPLHDMKSYFTHPGISIGAETKLNRQSTINQQLNGAFVVNKEMGSSFYIYTQTAFRFRIYHSLYGESKLGVGWQRDFHSTDAYEFKNGAWTKIHGGKSLLIIPVGISFSYKLNKDEKFVPFISYQVLPSLFYDDVLPLSFYNIIQAGVRVHFMSTHKN